MPGGRYQTNINVSERSVGSILVQVKSPSQTIYVQKITYVPTTIIPGTVVTFLDSITGQSIGLMTVMPASINQSPYVIDFSIGVPLTAGSALTKGANLILGVTSGGISGRLYIQCYQLPLFNVPTYVAPHTAGFTV